MNCDMVCSCWFPRFYTEEKIEMAIGRLPMKFSRWKVEGRIELQMNGGKVDEQE